MVSINLPAGPAEPNCSRCGAHNDDLTRLITKTSNRNGNAGRPYLKCLPCERFVTFDDRRGTSANHQPCDCEKPSRLQLAGKAKGRKLHFVCATGTCGFYTAKVNGEGDVVVIEEDLIGRLAGLLI
ncbi:unnamed protein product [Zymoseptoria tritici ST99CH_3D1]|uniref:GRF-like zinc ribbon domain-containing protein n=1 Tax=Zymoseptoria tritici (strain ST99CH_3D7) TaxID=1276538 RepID=A0A1X7RCI2_ZYMT9|nr:unnamed protein product [Zymoseptoria tritici ST99CH_3D7]SMR43501.1 unnamed protein product [Zymoseptoria tritici ST99CH_3D1]